MQLPQDDLYLGRHVLEHGLVSRDALIECLFQVAQERKAAAARPLGIILTQRGLLAPNELNRIMGARVETATHRAFTELEVGKLLVGAGVVAADDMQRCVEAQEEAKRAGGAVPRLGEIVVGRGYATREQVERVLAYRGRGSFACEGCGLRVAAELPPPGVRYRCRKCGKPMDEVERTTTAGVGMRESSKGGPEQHEIDRAMAAYLKQKGLVRRDQLRDAQRLQMEFENYGLVVPLVELLRRSGALSWQQQQLLDRMDFAAIVKTADWKQQAIPGYRLMSRIAAGGFATIYGAEPLFGGSHVAVKILHPEREKDSKAVARFKREAGLMRHLSHPNIVRGLEYGQEGPYHYIVMEHVAGRSLGQMIAESGAFPVREAVAVTRQIAEGLRYLHAEGWLHRDVKPDNALVDEDGHVKVCDLGFAAPIASDVAEGARVATAVGTAGYMSPEVVRGEANVKVGADIYSLGILFYALLTGYEPFTGVSSTEVVADQIESGMPVPDLIRVRAPAAVVQCLKRLLHLDRLKRFRTVVDVIDALERLATE